MRFDVRVIPLVVSLQMCAVCSAADWITAPSYYTHDPQTGQRVDQYTPIGPFYTFGRSDYLQSGYRHTRSTIQTDLSVDHMHIVEEWGRPVRPYGEWQFPYRPYSVPYPMWGAPFAGMQSRWPGMQPGWPGMQPRWPGMQPGGPGMQPGWPGMQPGWPGMQPGGPGMQPGGPGMQPPWANAPHGANQGAPDLGWEGDRDPYGRQQPPPYMNDTYAPYRSRPRE